jgi:hypothetical protein
MPVDAGTCGDLVRACRDVATSSGGCGISKYVPISQAFGPLLTLATVIVGWAWVSKDNNKRESRKELRANLNEIRELVLSIEATARTYLQRPPTDEETHHLGFQIRRDLQHLAGRLATLKAWNETFVFDNEMLGYRSCITGKDFDTKARKARAFDDQLFLEICNSGQNLIDTIERAFAEKYSDRPNRPRKG